MGSHPLNLALRFILELCGLGAMAYWGWTQHTGILQVLLGFGLPIFFAILWGAFAVPNDPSRSGKTVIAVRGAVRLVLEIAFFGLAIVLLFSAGSTLAAVLLAVFVMIHYALSWDRLQWLLKQ